MRYIPPGFLTFNSTINHCCTDYPVMTHLQLTYIKQPEIRPLVDYSRQLAGPRPASWSELNSTNLS